MTTPATQAGRAYLDLHAAGLIEPCEPDGECHIEPHVLAIEAGAGEQMAQGWHHTFPWRQHPGDPHTFDARCVVCGLRAISDYVVADVDEPRLFDLVRREASASATTALTRFEVIDHRAVDPDMDQSLVGARTLVAYGCVSLAYQDDGRTLKVFLGDESAQPAAGSAEPRWPNAVHESANDGFGPDPLGAPPESRWPSRDELAKLDRSLRGAEKFVTNQHDAFAQRNALECIADARAILAALREGGEAREP